MHDFRRVISGLTIDNAMAAYPELINKFPIFTPKIGSIKVMRFELFKYKIPGLIPNLTMIERLICLPATESDDPYHLENYRIRPQTYDVESENLLVCRNNRVTAWLDNKRINPTNFDTSLSVWCEKYNISYELVSYFQNVIKYCRLILPGTYSNPDKGSKNIKAFKKIDPFLEDADCLSEIEKSSQLTKELREAYKRDYYLSRRFPEYGLAVNFIYRMEQHPTYITELRAVHFDEAERINTENRTNEKKRYSGDLDCLILTQCMFCYKFHLQDPSRRNSLSRYCPDHHKTFDNWGTYLIQKGEFKQSEVYRDGFYRD
jgi:hypothetical protein